MTNLLEFDRDALAAFCEQLGEKRFRATQLFRWIHHKGASDFAQMSDLAKSLRDKLAGHAFINAMPVISEQASNDGTSFEVMIDPKQKEAHTARINYDSQKIEQVLWNPSVGQYDVQVDVGPDYGTRRQEAVNSLTLLLTQAPQLTSIIGDILLRNSDFDQADEAAARLRRMVPPHALGEGPSVTEQQMAQQLQEMQKLLQGVMEELAHGKIKLKGKDALRQVDSFKALTDRLKMLFDSVNKTKQTEINAHAVPGGEGAQSAASQGVTTAELEMLIAQALKETFNVSLDPVVDATAPVLQEAAMGANGQGGNPLLAGTPRPVMHVGADGATYARDYSQSPSYRQV